MTTSSRAALSLNDFPVVIIGGRPGGFGGGDAGGWFRSLRHERRSRPVDAERANWRRPAARLDAVKEGRLQLLNPYVAEHINRIDGGLRVALDPVMEAPPSAPDKVGAKAAGCCGESA